jgi:hypothetical protein
MTLILTRYLYEKQQVEFSLLVSILLKRDRDESKFWAYELYHSGFKLEVIAYILKLYYHLYHKHYPELEKYFDKRFQVWTSEQNDETYVGILVENLVIRKPHESRPNPNIYIKLKAEDVHKYKTKPVLESKGWKIPKRECKYKLTTKPDSESLTIRSYDNWLYHASFSPIWKNRIDRYCGKIEHETQTIVFENEDAAEHFDKWHNYEPDEQPKWVQDNWIGEKHNPSISLDA